MVQPEPSIFADLALSQRLENAEAHGNREFVEARAKLFPESGAQWIEVAGTSAMFDGPESPVTQTFGLGMFQPITAPELETVETFFHGRGAGVFHEVSPLADPTALALLNDRGYQPLEFSSVLFRSIKRGVEFAKPRNERISTRLIAREESEVWAQTAAKGWSEFVELGDLILGLSRITAERDNALSFIAELDGKPIATGAMSICDGVALLAGASTIPEARQQGAQLALLDKRLRYAAEQGCDLAMMCTLPGSGSQRNAERQGFRIAYTRIKWQLPGAAT
jgi:hypothetical protein